VVLVDLKCRAAIATNAIARITATISTSVVVPWAEDNWLFKLFMVLSFWAVEFFDA